LSEHHAHGETDEETGEYTEDLAAQMLATTLGVEFDPTIAWKEREQVFKMGGKIVRTLNITQSAIGKPGRWTTVVALAVFIPLENLPAGPLTCRSSAAHKPSCSQRVHVYDASRWMEYHTILGLEEPWCHPDQAGVYVLPALRALQPSRALTKAVGYH
jgi:hypothetical protein